MSLLNDLKKKFGYSKQVDGKDLQTVMGEEIKNKSVITSYNQRVYQVDEIDFTMTPLSEFESQIRNDKGEI